MSFKMMLEKNPAYERDGDCPYCDGGKLWKSMHEKVCDDCDSVIDEESIREEIMQTLRKAIEENERPKHDNSGIPILDGGYPDAY